MKKKKLLEDLYGERLLYNDLQANRLIETMAAMQMQNSKYDRAVSALRWRYTSGTNKKYSTWAEVGKIVGHYITAEPLSRERARQMACWAMRCLQHPHRKKYILEGKHWPGPEVRIGNN